MIMPVQTKTLKRSTIMLSKAIFIIIGLFYTYGAAVHVMNMLSMSGFNWLSAPLKWQALDVVYLILDAAVVLGLLFAFRIGLVAFFAAAMSQILLYTVFRKWIIDVPAEFQRSPEEVAYLDGLVAFHVVTILLMILALWLRYRTA